jgi:pimeloyl-ACP methyl ester carboxylesterase
MAPPQNLGRGALPLAWCALFTLAAGCATFQTGASDPLPEAERVVLPGRGQLRVIDRSPERAPGRSPGRAPGPPAQPGADVETVLLVHGYGSSTASYAQVIPRIAERYRVLAVDLPGFGKSDRRGGDYSPDALADVLAQILDQKGVRRVHLVGHSWGCSVALAFARRHRDRLDKLVIISGWMYDEQLLPLMRWARVAGLGSALYTLFYRQQIGERLYLNFADPSEVTDETVRGVEAQMARPGAVAAALAAARGMRFAEGEYRKIDAETLILWGREDRVARPAFGERLARELPRARLVVFPRCAHIPMLECRGETAQALRQFLDGGDR